MCNKNWDYQDAKVLCNQLGYNAAIAAVNGEALDSMNDGLTKVTVRMTEVNCKGNEAAIEVIIQFKSKQFSVNLLNRYARTTFHTLKAVQGENPMPE